MKSGFEAKQFLLDRPLMAVQARDINAVLSIISEHDVLKFPSLVTFVNGDMGSRVRIVGYIFERANKKLKE